MPIPNLSSLYFRIAKGSEGGHEFARFMKLLLNSDFTAQKVNFISESDASGDYRKLDGYIPGDKDFPNLITGFQFKFYPAKLSSNQKIEIENSIKAAVDANETLDDFILVTPEDFAKEQQAWFDSVRKKYERVYDIESNGILRTVRFRIQHWGHTKIVELSLKHDHIGSKYFPELFPAGVGKFKLSSANIDSSLCTWLQSKYNKNGYYQTPELLEVNIRTTDPVLDFQFKNSTPNIHLLHRVEIHVEKVWTTLKGFPMGNVLKSMGTIEYEVDFKKDINLLEFADPIIFPANTPQRFHLLLKNFNPHGNWAQLKFWFYFDEITIPTDSYIFSL